MGMVTILTVIFISFLLLSFWAISVYNKLVQLKAFVKEGWSGIDVQLKRRYDLIPNLIAVVKQYSVHEKEVLESVTKMRSASMGAQTVEGKAEAESGLAKALKTLFAVSENYPNLKANENFLSLQKDLGVIEHELQLARRYYNGATRNYNIVVSSFPSNMVANATGFEKECYFTIDTAEGRERHRRLSFKL